MNEQLDDDVSVAAKKLLVYSKRHFIDLKSIKLRQSSIEVRMTDYNNPFECDSIRTLELCDTVKKITGFDMVQTYGDGAILMNKAK